MQPVFQTAARVLDYLTRGLANPCGDGVSSRRLGSYDDAYMPVHVERVSETTYSVAHYCDGNAHACDPAMVFKKCKDGSWLALSIQQLFDGCVEHYGIILDGNEEPVRIAPRRAADIRKFTSLWMRNIKAQQNIKLSRQPRGPRRITAASMEQAAEERVIAWLAGESEAFTKANGRTPKSAREAMEWSAKTGREGILSLGDAR